MLQGSPSLLDDLATTCCCKYMNGDDCTGSDPDSRHDCAGNNFDCGVVVLTAHEKADREEDKVSAWLS